VTGTSNLAGEHANSGQFRSSVTPEERFRNLTNRTETCWLWTGRPTPQGYGSFKVAGKYIPPHRWAYEQFIGPIPDGLQIDHVCHSEDSTCPGGAVCSHRRCVNPAHLEAVTAAENSRRAGSANRDKTHCPRGHEYSSANTYVNPRTRTRFCRTCKQMRGRKAKAAGREI
jgi:hypothetical protein